MRPGIVFILIASLLLSEVASAATEWSAIEPARVGLHFKVLRDIPDLDDPALTRELRALESSLPSNPTGNRNIEDRALLLSRYYDALQNSGVLLNWRIGSEINQMRSRIAANRLQEDHSFHALVDQRFRELRRAHQLSGQTGKMILREPAKPELNAKTHDTVRLEYIVDTPLQQGARIRLGQNWYSDLGRLQFTRPLDENFASASASRKDIELLFGSRLWQGGSFTGLSGGNRPVIEIKQGSLQPGDKITFVLGDTSGGSPGWMIQSFTNDAMDLRFEIDFAGDGIFVPVAQPRFRVYGKDTSHVRVVAPSVIRSNETFTVRASVEDAYFNRAAHGLPRQLELWHGETRVAKARPIKGDPATFHFENVSVDSTEDQPVYLTVRDAAGNITGTSNPIVTRATGPRLYWGELHGHEGYTDANGSPEWYMNYAKNVAFLDFAALTGHDVMLSEVHFRHNFLVTDAFNVPEQGFVSFRAYEWTNGWQFGGHHNVFLQDDQQMPVTVMQAPQLRDMIKLQKEHNAADKVLIIPHAHQPGDWEVAGTDLIEVFSQHGSFEWFGREYLMKGHKVGLHAASDDHLGHPGNAPSRGKSRGGLGAVFADAIDRSDIFDNLKARHTYGTSFARIYLETDVSGQPMGSNVKARGKVGVKGFTAGTHEVADVTLVVNGRDAQHLRWDEPTAHSTRLRFRIHVDSTPGENPNAPRTPQSDKRYWGRIFVHKAGETPGMSEGSQSRTTINAVTPLGTEYYADRIEHTGRHEATFTFRIRGDHDGAILDLKDIDPNDLVTVRIMTSTLWSTEHWNIPELPRLPGEAFDLEVPGRQILVEETISLKDLQTTRWEHAFDDRASADLVLVGPELPTWRKFEFEVDETDGLKPGDVNHVYVRVRQLDDETAWSSPTFIDWQPL